jgi:Protein phosphatase 2C
MQRQDLSASVVIETNQRGEGRERYSLGGSMAVLLHSVRCQEAQSQGLTGQDYARLVSRQDGACICFCVCDGVGSSYQGDFAARYLGECLVNWMLALDAVPRRVYALEHELRAELARWSRVGQDDLVAADPPRSGSALEREVLAELRDQYGSETVFLAGRVDTTPAMPAGDDVSEAAHLLFCWMGNISAYFCSGQQRRRIFACVGDDDRARWSTVQGMRGKLRMQRITATTPWRLVVHTDGLASLGDAILTMSEDDIEREEQRLLGLPTNDDMTLLAVEWH